MDMELMDILEACMVRIDEVAVTSTSPFGLSIVGRLKQSGYHQGTVPHVMVMSVGWHLNHVESSPYSRRVRLHLIEAVNTLYWS